jgi:preprotein translocase subunit SecA
MSFAVDVQFVLSLEDAMLKAFCGDWVASTLRSLGMNESEAIESNMVARRIKAAQRKIERRCTEAIRPARSAVDWMTNNLV